MSFNAIPFFGLNFQKDEYLLDLASAGFAFSVRKLNRDYTGPCIRIRNSLGNQLDINFVDNYVDIDAINTFRNLGNGFASVSILYDQSGNGFNLTGSLTSYEPTLAESSSSYNLYTNNGILSMRNRGRMSNSSFFTYFNGLGEAWIGCMIKPTLQNTGSSEGIFVHLASETALSYCLFNKHTSTNGWRTAGRRLVTDSLVALIETTYNGTFHNAMSRFHYSSSDLYLYENNILKRSTTSFQTDGVLDSANKLFGIGANVNTPSASIFTGQYSEVILFTGSLNKDLVYENQKDFFSLT